MIGKTILHYKILEKIGGGGMGIIYKAQDLKLDRHVALKFLPPHLTSSEEEKQRFIHEAKAASSLDHNNICAIHEIDETEDGQLFISMAYYEGETLDKKIKEKPLPINETIDLAIQIAQGLAKAHEKEIVHRDIKPANIMLTKEGVVKILDFGLAKLSTQTKLTKESTTLGTVAYMSPEQARGEVVDQKTDIFSLGVIIYEMLTGQLPFNGEYESAIIYSIIHDVQEPVTALRTGVPMELERIINKCLEKSPGDRYQHVDDLIVDLRRLKRDSESKIDSSRTEILRGSPTKSKKPILISVTFLSAVIMVVVGYLMINKFIVKDKPQSDVIGIAILPFDDLSPEGDQEWFCDGMTEQLISTFGRLSRLKVIGRKSVMQYKGTQKTNFEIGQELNVSHILESSLRKSGDRIRITSKLIKTDDGLQIWSGDFDEKYKAFIDVQDDISDKIASSLIENISSEELADLKTVKPKNKESYDAYLLGRFHWNKRTKEGLEKAIDFFELAIQQDSSYALAYTGLADAYIMLPFYGNWQSKAAYPNAINAVKKSLEIDSSLAESYATLGIIKENFEWKFEEADELYKRSIELNPNYATGHFWRGMNLPNLNRLEEGIIELKKAIVIDPYSPIINTNLGDILYWSGNYDKAIVQYERTLELNPNFASAHWGLGLVYLQKERYADAVEEFEKCISTDVIGLSELPYAFMKLGNQEKALEAFSKLKQLSKGEYIDPVVFARAYIGLGQKDKAFKALENAYQKRSVWLIDGISHDPYYNVIQNDKRYKNLLKKIGLRIDQ